MAKVTRHNHPLMVNARRESYNAGLGDGYKNGYKQGCEDTQKKLNAYYGILIRSLEKHIDALSSLLKDKEDQDGH